MTMVEVSNETESSHMAKLPSKFVSFYRKIYRPVGFVKGYNFPLFIVFAGAMFGFSLARVSYIDISSDAPSSFLSNAVPGAWYWYSKGHYRIGLTIHLACIIPAGLLMVWQFVPIIRHKFLIFHRINGYIVIILTLLANAGATMIARRSFGGTTATQAGVGTLVILTTISMGMAYYNIKRLQIDQHRAWMLRAMFYFGTIITLRIIQIIATRIISQVGGYYITMSCEEIRFMYGGGPRPLLTFYPQCANETLTTGDHVAVEANFDAAGRPDQIGASLWLNFDMAMWMALLLHAVGVEIYLALTPAESHRLRMVSYERQLEAGFSHPGSSGLTADRWGDAEEWKPTRNVYRMEVGEEGVEK